MAKLLYNLGKWVYERPKRVLAFWVLAIVIMTSLALNLGINFKGDMTIPGTKSEKAGKVLQKAFGKGKDQGSIRLIFKVKDGKSFDDTSVKEAVNKLITKVQDNDKAVIAVSDPYKTGTINSTRKIGYADITYKVPADDVKNSSKNKVLNSLKITRNKGIKTELGGSVKLSGTTVEGTSEAVSIVVAFFILVITFGSLLAAGLPIVTALIGLAAGLMGVILATNFFSMSSLSISLASMVGLAVGIDYALFIVSRFRQNVSDGNEIKEALALAMGTAGSSVLFAGTTVIIALCGLSLVGVPFLGVMGLAAAFVVFSVILVSLTAVPAVIRLTGKHIAPRKKKKANVKEKNKESNLWGRFVTKHPVIIILAVILLAVGISYSALDMQLGLPDNATKPKNSTERKGYDIIAEGFGKGFNGKLVVVVDGRKAGSNSQKAIQNSANKIKDLSDIASMTPPIPNKTGKIAIINIIPKSGPNDEKTKDLVKDIRNLSSDTEKTNDVKLMVTGTTAVNIDISDKLAQALPEFAIVVLGLAFVLMTIVFRSILVPIKAVLGFLMTLGATMGFAVLTLHKGNFAELLGIPRAAPILCFIPIIAVGILFGLAMDYEVFLVSRMRENYTKTGDAKKSVTSGIKLGGTVVSAAGLIMISVFASFATNGDINLKSMGLPLAFGIFFDAFIVRMTFVPAVMALLGNKAWYMPKWLDKILPKFDIEGDSLPKEEGAA
ncbi:MMPL family transporter [Clostridium oryzae]|uniref:Membrane protein YdfJ n=1 Tax=Clostridium oryzae TaxID=1450648 RepID=A0A1V4IDX0_9CLOT|nr:MMPL family transporter [Clostridium oryzae]OPJ58182.1 membrane protein YdfJ [Clostridium oryzae]